MATDKGKDLNKGPDCTPSNAYLKPVFRLVIRCLDDLQRKTERVTNSRVSLSHSVLGLDPFV